MVSSVESHVLTISFITCRKTRHDNYVY